MDHSVIVIGSAFGGSVSALRLTERCCGPPYLVSNRTPCNGEPVDKQTRNRLGTQRPSVRSGQTSAHARLRAMTHHPLIDVVEHLLPIEVEDRLVVPALVHDELLVG